MIPDKEEAPLAIPKKLQTRSLSFIIPVYSQDIQGVIKTYLMISDKFFIPHLMHYWRSFLSAYHICQLFRNDKPPSLQLETRINLNYSQCPDWVWIWKWCPDSQKGHRYILYMIDEMTNYLITAHLYQARSEEVGEALIENIISKFGTAAYMMMDQDSAFTSSLMSYLFKKFGITIKMVGPYNHKSLQAEHGIKSLSRHTV